MSQHSAGSSSTARATRHGQHRSISDRPIYYPSRYAFSTPDYNDSLRRHHRSIDDHYIPSRVWMDGSLMHPHRHRSDEGGAYTRRFDVDRGFDPMFYHRRAFVDDFGFMGRDDFATNRLHHRRAPHYVHGIFDDRPTHHDHHFATRTGPPPPPTPPPAYYAPPPPRPSAYPVLTDGTFYDNFSSMFMFPRWMKRALGRFGVPSGRSLESLRGNVDGSNLHEVWEQFLESNEMKRILKASKPRHLPTEVVAWERPLRTATRLWKELENVSVEATPIVYPVLCLLFKGTYLMQRYGKDGRKRLLQQDAAEGLVRAALVVTAIECPPGFLKQLLEKHPRQLEERLNGKTPLWVLLEDKKEDLYRYRYTPNVYPELLATMIAANPNVASITYKNRYPLHQACQRGYVWNNGLESLAKAAPQAVQASANAPGLLHPVAEVGLAHAEARAARQAADDEDMFNHYHSAYHRSYYHQSQQMARAERDAVVTDTLFELLMMDPTFVTTWTPQEGKLAIEGRCSFIMGGPPFLW